MKRRAGARAVTVVAALITMMSGCAVSPDARPTPIEAANLSTRTNELSAEGSARVYFVGPGEGELLQAVARDAKTRGDLIKILLQGPNTDELAQDYFSAIPVETKLNSIRPLGQALQLDFSDELKQLSGPALSHALAQIVYTATDIDGVENVQISVDGEKVEWLGPGSSDGLSVYDFPGAVRTSQPAYPAGPAVPTARA